MQYEAELVTNAQLRDQILCKSETIESYISENHALTGIVSKEHAASEELRVRIANIAADNKDLITQRDQLKAKIQTLIATVHLLARAADGNPDNPIDPLF